MIGVLAGVLLVYVVLLAMLWSYARRHPDTITARDALRLLPDLLGLLRRLATDPQVPRSVRIRVLLLLIYLASPIDLIPDFIPVVGFADDAVIVALVLRSVVRHAGTEALNRHWHGTPAGLALIHQLAGVS